MKSKTIKLCSGLALMAGLCGSYLFSFPRKAKPGSALIRNQPIAKPGQSDFLAAFVPLISAMALPQVKEKASDFDSPLSLEQIKQEILESGAYIAMTDRRRSFQQSRIDSFENAQKAIAIIAQSYPDVITEERATKKVLALALLTYSKHLSVSNCNYLFHSTIENYKIAIEHQIKQALKFDLGSIAYMCKEKAGAKFLARVESLSDAALKSQCHNAITRYEQDEQRG